MKQELKIFNLTCNIEFFAENLDDAFKKLARHFSDLMQDKPSDLVQAGQIELKPRNNNDT